MARNSKPAKQAVLLNAAKADLTNSERIEAYGVDRLMDDIAGGESLTTLSAGIGVKRSTLHDWLHAEPGRSARARSSRQRSAEAYEESAEREIRLASDPFELAKAKELAHHFRWAARVRSPQTHGEKLEVSGNAESPLAVSHKLDTSGLSDEQLRVLAGIKLGASDGK